MSLESINPAQPRTDAHGGAMAGIQAGLKDKEHHLAMVFNSARDMMLLAKVEPGVLVRIVSVNRTYIETVRAEGFDLKAGDLEGLTFENLVGLFRFDAETVAVMRERIERVIRTRETLEFNEVTRTDGGVFHGRTTLTPIPDATGACGFVLYSSEDITPQMRAEQALAENQRVLATLMANLPGMAYRCRNDAQWTMEFVSEGCQELTGYPPDSLIGNRDLSYECLIYPDDRERVRQEVDAALASGLRFELTYRIVTVDGSVKWVNEQGIAIKGQDGAVVYLEGIVTDITARKCAEMALIESERTLSAILDHSFQFIGLLDLSGRVIKSNLTSLEAIGVRREEVEGRYFWETPWWTHSVVEQQRLRDAINRASGGEFVRFETSHLAKDGRMISVDFSLKPVRDEQGRVVMMIPEGRDVTEQKNAAAALLLSEEKFHRAFESSPNNIVISRQSDGLIMDANQAFLRARDMKIDQVRGRTVFELGLWADVSSRQRLLEELQRSGRVRDYPMEINLPGGGRGTVLLAVDPIVVQGELCMLTTSIDITEKIEAERALRESEEKFAKAFRNSPYSLTISDMETGRYIDVNSGFELLSGYTRAEVLGRTSSELNLWLDLADREKLIRRLQETGTVRGLELSFRAKDGRVVITLCNCERIELAGRSCLLNVIEDISERRRSEKEKALLEAQLRQNQKLESLGTLAGGIAHDFNNILTAIMVNQEVAMMDLRNPESLTLRLNEISRASKRAKDLVSQILTFSRQQPYRRERQQLQPIIKETLSLVRASTPSTIEMVQELSADAPASRVDATQVHQIVMNLCTNAAHAMRERSGRLTVQLRTEVLDEGTRLLYPGLAPGSYARLTVQDTGCGMTDEVKARLFEPFFTTKGPGEGTGLGLPVVHGIIKDYEGGIFVQSRLGEGSVFDLFFPAATEMEASRSQPPVVVHFGRGESVLLVDDEPSVCDAVAAMLRKIGYRVEKFSEPLFALERLRHHPESFDILITDRTMPRLTGPALIAQAQLLRPGLPALLMSGLNYESPMGGSEAKTTYASIAKPVSMAALSQAVRHALSSRHADQSWTP
jgi:two-component system, cell cycle sensor histidine kinase and response regulator CckA